MDIRTDVNDGVATITLDDGKRNALTIEAFVALVDAFDAVPPDATAIVVAGREGVLSAGLDVKWMAAAGRDDIRTLLVAFGSAMMRIWTEPRPTVCAATGHAVAGGTMIAMACDHAVAAEGDWAWGLTETQIDFEMPDFGLALAQHNVRVDWLEDLVLPGRRVDAATAVAVGYADELAPADEVVTRARAVAAELGALPARAYAGTKARLRGVDAAAIMSSLVEDVESLTGHLPD